jgi:hypothetical protein
MSLPQILAAIIAAFLVTQLAIFTTTVYLHRVLTGLHLARVRHDDVHMKSTATS